MRNALSEYPHMQCTIERSVHLSGKGLFTGKAVSLSLHPQEENVGIVFRRNDLPNAPLIPAHFRYVSSTFRSTRLQNEEADVLMVEHLLSALHAFAIDNVEIVIDAEEIPCGDGSAKIFVDLLKKAGQKKQTASRKIRK